MVCKNIWIDHKIIEFKWDVRNSIFDEYSCCYFTLDEWKAVLIKLYRNQF